MKLNYDEFKKELEKRIDDVCHWIESIDHGYGSDINKEDFEEMKEFLVEDLECFREKAIEDFGEYLED